MSNKIWQQPYTFSFFSPPLHVSLLQNKGNLLCCPHKLQFCHDNSQRDWHGNVHDNVNVFGFGGIDLLRCCCCCGRASTETCYCQYVHNMLLWACKKYCCCIYNIHEITPYSIHVSPRSRSIQVELGKVKVFWSTLRTATTAIVIYLNVEQRAHWLPIQERTNQLCHVMMSVGQIELDLSDCAISSCMPELCICLTFYKIVSAVRFTNVWLMSRFF